MPRVVKEPEDDSEAKNGRRTRALLLATATESPLRRSTRIRHGSTNPDGSSPESIVESGNAPVTRTSRRRATAETAAPPGTPRTLRARRNSLSSNVSDMTDLDSGARTPSRRNTRRSIAVLPSAETSKTNTRATKRTGRAVSETKSSPPVVRSTRRTRANSVDPDPINEPTRRGILAQSTPQPATPTRSRRRASALLIEPVLEIVQENKLAFSDVSEVPEAEMEIDSTPEIKSSRKSQEKSSPASIKKSSKNESVNEEPNIANEEMVVDDRSDCESFIKSPGRSSLASAKKSSRNKSLKEEIKSTSLEGNEPPQASRNKDDGSKELEDSFTSSAQLENEESSKRNLSARSSKRNSLERSKELGLKIEDLLNKSAEEQEKSPGNKENEKLNILPGRTKRSLEFTVANVTLLGRKSLGSAFFTEKSAKGKQNTSLDEQVLSRSRHSKGSETSILLNTSRKSLEAEDVEVLHNAKRLSFKKQASKEDYIIKIEDEISNDMNEPMDVVEATMEVDEDNRSKIKHTVEVPDNAANLDDSISECYVRLDKTMVDDIEIIEEVTVLDHGESAKMPKKKHSVSQSVEALQVEQKNTKKQLDTEKKNSHRESILGEENEETPEKQKFSSNIVDITSKDKSSDDYGNNMNENENQQIDKKPKPTSRRTFSEGVKAKTNDTSTKRLSLNVNKKDNLTVSEDKIENQMGEHQQHIDEPVTDHSDLRHKDKRKSSSQSSAESENINSEVCSMEKTADESPDMGKPLGKLNKSMPSDSRLATERRKSITSKENRKNRSSIGTMEFQPIESGNQTENASLKKHPLISQDKPSEKTAESLNEGNFENQQVKNLRNESSKANVDSESDVSLGNLFHDIPADEWEMKKNKNSTPGDEMSSLHSLSTERLENDSEVDYDLVLVDKDAWKAAEEERNASKLEYDDYYESDDTVILKSRHDASQIESEKVGNKRKSLNTLDVGVMEFDSNSGLAENVEMVHKSLTNRKSLNKSGGAGDRSDKALRKSDADMILEDAAMDNENIREMKHDNLENTAFKNEKRKSLNKSLTKTNRSFRGIDQNITGSDDDDMEQDHMEEIVSKKEKRKSLNKSLTKTSQVLNKKDTETDDEENKQDHEEKTVSKNDKRESLNKSLSKTNGSFKVIEKEESSENESEDKSDSNTDESGSEKIRNLKRESSKTETSKQTFMDKNYSTVAVVDSDSGSDDVTDPDAESSNDSHENVPSFLYNVTSSESEDGMDSDIARELNLDGNTSLVYSDDDVPADDCRASESEYSDDEDGGSDLDDFVVNDDEVSEEDEDSEEDDDSEVEKTDTKKYKRIISDSTSDESKGKEDEEVDDEKEHSSTEKITAQLVIESDDSNDSDIPRSSRKVKKLDISQHSDAPVFTPSPRNESFNKSSKNFRNEAEATSLLSSGKKDKNDSLNLDVTVETNSDKKSKKLSIAEDLEKSNLSVSEKSIKKKLIDELNLSDTKSPRKKSKAAKESNVFTEETPKSEKKSLSKSANMVEEIDVSKLKTPKISTLNKSMQTPNTETPVTKFLKKERLNESLPPIELNKKAKKMKKRNAMDDMDEDEREDDIGMGHENEKDSENDRVSDKRDDNDDVEDGGDEINGDDDDDNEEGEDEGDDEDEEEIHEDETEDEENESAEEEEESSQEEIDVESKKTLKQKQRNSELKELTNGKRPRAEASEESESESELEDDRTSKIKKISKTEHKKSGSISDSDEAPESVGFTEARTEALEAMKNAAASVKAGKDAQKKKRREQLERIRLEKEAKVQRLVQEGKTIPVKSNLKRLPDDILENISDVPVRPQKRQKLSNTKEKIMPSKSMFSPGKPTNLRIEVDDGLIPLSSSGGTTQFGIVNLEIVKKKQPKKAAAVASFREQMLSRNPRQPVSAFLMYQEKQKASGKNKFPRRPT